MAPQRYSNFGGMQHSILFSPSWLGGDAYDYSRNCRELPEWMFLAIALSFLPVMNLYGPQAALIAESFAPRLRYSGAGLGYQLASIVAGGPAPFIATALFAAFHTGYAIAFYILGCAVISMIATSLLTDHTNKDIS